MRFNIIQIILPILIGMACATSCSSDPDSDVLDYEKGEELKFEVADGSTRATTITTTKNLTDHPFMLFGDVNRKAESTDHSGLRTLFEQVKVTYDKKANNWDYDTKQYWHMGQEHSFVAIHPFDILVLGISNVKYEDSKVSFTYEMPEEDSDKILENTSVVKDIVVATHRRKYNLDSDKSGPVIFKFEHLLSRINVAPALNQKDHMYLFEDSTKKDPEFHYDLIRNEFIQIRKVELIGFYTKADYSIKPGPLGSETKTDSRELTWEEDKTSSKTISFYIPEKDSPHIYDNSENVCVLDSATAIMMIPQTFSNDAKIKLEYTVNTDNSKPTELRSVTVPLKGKTLERGKSYTMKFTIEDVYKGQIAESSLKWEVKDMDNPDSYYKINWIDHDSGTIRQEFIIEEDQKDS